MCAGTPWDFEGPGFTVDDPYLHIYTDGHWGTWGDPSTAIGATGAADAPHGESQQDLGSHEPSSVAAALFAREPD